MFFLVVRVVVFRDSDTQKHFDEQLNCDTQLHFGTQQHFDTQLTFVGSTTKFRAGRVPVPLLNPRGFQYP